MPKHIVLLARANLCLEILVVSVCVGMAILNGVERLNPLTE